MKRMTEIEGIVDELQREYGGDAWYGSSLRDILKDVTAAQAAARPVLHAHSIWELVLHVTAWKREVAARIQGRPAGEPAEGDWPAAPSDGQATDARVGGDARGAAAGADRAPQRRGPAAAVAAARPRRRSAQPAARHGRLALRHAPRHRAARRVSCRPDRHHQEGPRALGLTVAPSPTGRSSHDRHHARDHD